LGAVNIAVTHAVDGQVLSAAILPTP
jgi:hypothetical protein